MAIRNSSEVPMAGGAAAWVVAGRARAAVVGRAAAEVAAAVIRAAVADGAGEVVVTR